MVNRVRKTQTQTELSQWRYGLTKCNPENRTTGGMAVKDTENSYFWQCGPEFLRTTEDKRPNRQISSKPTNKEKKSVGPNPADDCNNVMMETQKSEETGS